MTTDLEVELEVMIARAEGELTALRKVQRLLDLVRTPEVEAIPTSLLIAEEPIKEVPIPGYSSEKMSRVLSEEASAAKTISQARLREQDEPPAKKRVRASIEQRRLELVKDIATNGPESCFKIGQRLGFSDMSVRIWIKDCSWFQKDGSRIGLTPEGYVTAKGSTIDLAD